MKNEELGDAARDSGGSSRGATHSKQWCSRSVRRGTRTASLAGVAVLMGLTLVPAARAGNIHVISARIGCLDVQHEAQPELTELVRRRCEGRLTCNYRAPTPKQYRAAGVHAATRSLCTQAMDIQYDCGDNGWPRTAWVRGDAWKHPPAHLDCRTVRPPAGGIHIDSARIGCLDIQHNPNLTALVQNQCEGRFTCDYKAPAPKQYRAAGVHAATRTLCTQAMDIKYHCANGVRHRVTVPGNAWKHPPVHLVCPHVQTGPGPMVTLRLGGGLPPGSCPGGTPTNSVHIDISGASPLGGPVVGDNVELGEQSFIVLMHQGALDLGSVVPGEQCTYNYWLVVKNEADGDPNCRLAAARGWVATTNTPGVYQGGSAPGQFEMFGRPGQARPVQIRRITVPRDAHLPLHYRVQLCVVGIDPARSTSTHAVFKAIPSNVVQFSLVPYGSGRYPR